MTIPADTLPQNTGSGYVAAAYIVFFAILLIYVAIMALRLTRVERRLNELQAPPAEPSPVADPPAHGETAGAGAAHAGDAPPHEGAPGQALEREPA